MKNQLLIDVKYLHPTLRDKDGGINAIPRLANLVVSCLGESFHSVFLIDKEVTMDELVEMISTGDRLYQIEHIPERMFINDKSEETKMKKVGQHPYWKYAYALVGIDDCKGDANESYFRRIDEFWLEVRNIRDEITGELRYGKLSP